MIISAAKANIEILEKAKEIFWLTSSKKSFKNEKERQLFEYKYFSLYLENWPCSFYMYVADDKVLGYVATCVDTRQISALDDFYPYYKNIDGELTHFPSHLHINCHPSTQGMGVGSKLVAHVQKELRSQNSSGVHIFTAKSHPSVKFYQKNGFSESIECPGFDNIMMMGCRLA